MVKNGVNTPHSNNFTVSWCHFDLDCIRLVPFSLYSLFTRVTLGIGSMYQRPMVLVCDATWSFGR